MADLFESAAEALAYESAMKGEGRPYSQELAELKHPRPIGNQGMLDAKAAAWVDRAGSPPSLFVIEGERFDVVVDVRRVPHGGR